MEVNQGRLPLEIARCKHLKVFSFFGDGCSSLSMQQSFFSKEQKWTKVTCEIRVTELSSRRHKNAEDVTRGTALVCPRNYKKFVIRGQTMSSDATGHVSLVSFLRV